MRKLLGGIAVLCLAACGGGITPQQAQTAGTYQAQIAAACNVAMSLAPAAGPVAPWIVGGCGSEELIAKLALDPTSLAWVNSLIAKAS